jgi:hypothetical protein
MQAVQNSKDGNVNRFRDLLNKNNVSTTDLFLNSLNSTTNSLNKTTHFTIFENPINREDMGDIRKLMNTYNEIKNFCNFYRQVEEGPFSLEQGIEKLDMQFPEISKKITTNATREFTDILARNKNEIKAKYDELDNKIDQLFRKEEADFQKDFQLTNAKDALEINTIKEIPIEEYFKVSGEMQQLIKRRQDINARQYNEKLKGSREILLPYLNSIMQKCVDAIYPQEVTNIIALDFFPAIPKYFDAELYYWYDKLPKLEKPSMDVIFFSKAFSKSDAVYPIAGITIYEDGVVKPIKTIDFDIDGKFFSIPSSKNRLQYSIDNDALYGEPETHIFQIPSKSPTKNDFNETVSGLKTFVPVPKTTAKINNTTLKKDIKNITGLLREIQNNAEAAKIPEQHLQNLMYESEACKTEASMNLASLGVGGLLGVISSFISVAIILASKNCKKNTKDLFNNLNFPLHQTYGIPNEKQLFYVVKILQNIINNSSSQEGANHAEITECSRLSNSVNEDNMKNLITFLPYISEKNLEKLNDKSNQNNLQEFWQEYNKLEDGMINKMQSKQTTNEIKPTHAVLTMHKDTSNAKTETPNKSKNACHIM